MKNIYVVGGVGFAHECAAYLLQIAQQDKSIKFSGFLGHKNYGVKENYKSMQDYYLGDMNDFSFKENDYIVIGAGYSALRKEIYLDCKKLNLQFYTLITPNCYIHESLDCGEANIFISSLVSTHCSIGNGNLFNDDVKIAHDVSIGDFNFFGPRSSVLGECEIGNENSFGVNSLLLPGVSVGNNNKIAPLSAVYKRVKSNSYYLGNPATKVGEIKDE